MLQKQPLSILLSSLHYPTYRASFAVLHKSHCYKVQSRIQMFVLFGDPFVADPAHQGFRNNSTAKQTKLREPRFFLTYLVSVN